MVAFVEQAARGVGNGGVVGRVVEDVDVVGGRVGICEAEGAVGAGGDGEFAAMGERVAASEEGRDVGGVAEGAGLEGEEFHWEK